MKFRILSTIIVLLFNIQTIAITSSDLPVPLTYEVEKIVSEISPIESLCVNWNPYWSHDIKKDSVKGIIYKAIRETEELDKSNFGNNLLEGILWHYLYQIDVDSAFLKVQNLTNDFQIKFPQKFEGRWLKGINQILGANIDSGFKLMEDIRLNNENLPDNFYTDYIKLSELIFMPQQFSGISNTKNLNSNILPFKEIDLNIDERYPVSNGWSVISDLQNQKGVPIFSFSADFNLKKSFKMRYPSINKYKKFTMKIPPKPSIQRELSDSLIFNPDLPPVKMNMKILVDKMDSLESLDSYLLKFIYKQYDVIKPLKLEHKNMLALKCMNKSVTRNIDDEYIVFFAFDRPISLINKNIYSKNIDHSNPSTVRYVLALKTEKSVDKKADMLLYELAEKLIK